MVVDASLLRLEDRSPFRSEEPVGVEAADGFQKLVLPQADRRRQAGMQVGCGPVVLAGPAEVVRHTAGLHVAGHAPAAAVNHSSAKDVLAFGLRMIAERVVVARPALLAAVLVDLVEHPLLDQRLVDRLRRPDPLVGLVDPAALGRRGTAVEDLVAELRERLQTDESKRFGQCTQAESIGHQSGRRIVATLGTKKADLNELDCEHMRPVVGCIHRHLAWRYSLMNWCHDSPKHPDRAGPSPRLPTRCPRVDRHAGRSWADTVGDAGAGAVGNILHSADLKPRTRSWTSTGNRSCLRIDQHLRPHRSGQLIDSETLVLEEGQSAAVSSRVSLSRTTSCAWPASRRSVARLQMGELLEVGSSLLTVLAASTSRSYPIRTS
ncbi:DUF3140 domain-containing protein [Amycolatopsis sp., V23-08]|uniref:DUF3140 domain-containing protein n=1 Tax=Amycolatopsis heterodermiae TaxID=3110235 RepID=A0ABU5RD42_9PSEU|nr:DUF3140 domain-containing protein [Amycolatopsis sp., V23-08]MEA5364177.1 DUF3140 domain-containing protein [Amycolatopsis sp., V23-08]